MDGSTSTPCNLSEFSHDMHSHFNYCRLVAHAARHCDLIHAWYGGGPYGTHHTYPLQVARFAGKFLIANFAWDVPNVDPSVSILVVESESSLKRHYALRRLHNHGSHDASASMPAVHYILPGIDAQRFSSNTIPAFVPPGCTCHPPGCYKPSDPSSCFVIGRVHSAQCSLCAHAWFGYSYVVSGESVGPGKTPCCFC